MTRIEEDWEEAKPELNFFELDGHLRLRADLFHTLDLGNDAAAAVSGASPGARGV